MTSEVQPVGENRITAQTIREHLLLEQLNAPSRRSKTVGSIVRVITKFSTPERVNVRPDDYYVCIVKNNGSSTPASSFQQTFDGWEYPGGKVEAGDIGDTVQDTWINAALRELLEETSIYGKRSSCSIVQEPRLVKSAYDSRNYLWVIFVHVGAMEGVPWNNNTIWRHILPSEPVTQCDLTNYVRDIFHEEAISNVGFIQPARGSELHLRFTGLQMGHVMARSFMDGSFLALPLTTTEERLDIRLIDHVFRIAMSRPFRVTQTLRLYWSDATNQSNENADPNGNN